MAGQRVTFRSGVRTPTRGLIRTKARQAQVDVPDVCPWSPVVRGESLERSSSGTEIGTCLPRGQICCEPIELRDVGVGRVESKEQWLEGGEQLLAVADVEVVAF